MQQVAHVMAPRALLLCQHVGCRLCPCSARLATRRIPAPHQAHSGVPACLLPVRPLQPRFHCEPTYSPTKLLQGSELKLAKVERPLISMLRSRA